MDNRVRNRFKNAVKLDMLSRNFNYLDTSVPLKDDLRVKNKFMDKFFNELKYRLAHSERVHVSHVLIQINYAIIVAKTLLVMFVDMDLQNRLILSDLSILLGGIENYTNLAIVLSFCAGLSIRKLFNFTKDVKLFAWVDLFDMIRGIIAPKQLHLMPNDTKVLKLFLKRSALVMKVVQYSIVYAG